MYCLMFHGLMMAIFAREALTTKLVSDCGTSTENFSYPPLAIIDMLNLDYPKASAQDFGVIIAAQWVLSRTPCFQLHGDILTCNTDGYEFAVEVYSSNSILGGSIKAELIMHEGYSYLETLDLLVPPNDIALYKLREPLKFGSRVHPIELLEAESRINPGKTALVIGATLTRVPNGEYEFTLANVRRLNMTLIRRSQCETLARLRQEPSYVEALKKAYQEGGNLPQVGGSSKRLQGSLCVVDLDPKRREYCAYYYGSFVIVGNKLAGTISPSIDFFDQNYYEGGGSSPIYTYTDVTHYRDWIESHTGVRALQPASWIPHGYFPI